jgi:hypothetical protein
MDPALEAKPLPTAKPGETNVQIEAPLVFNASERATSQPPVAPVKEAAALPLPATPATPTPATVVLPPPTDPKPAHKGFFGKIKGFFSSIF